ncbi:MAG: Omp28-related outer membrane protein, partial [Candidatus Cloacimonetes bacterium]|nr:Omp28-related outer membrane protein [Candidatus Cloacimonadota bacterium]
MKKTLLTILFVLVISTLMADEVEREMVVLEIFTSTGCYYCPGAAMGAEDLIANGCDVAVIEYHSSDPFMNTYAVSRSSYYGVGGIPHAFFGGVLDVLGGNHSSSMYAYYLPKYNQRKAINSSFTIDIAGSNSGLDYNVTVTVNKVAETSSTDMVLHLALTESNIPYNWQGQTELHWVERLMVPDQYGTALDFSSDSTNTVNLSFTLDEDWEVDNCELAAFIQDINTKEVLQGTKVSLPEITSPPGVIEGIVALNGGSGNVEEVVVTADGVAANPDPAGYYIINIAHGIYDVTASLEGYRDSTIVGVEVFADQVTGEIDFTLEVYNGPPDWEPISGTQCHMVLMAEITLEGEEF